MKKLLPIFIILFFSLSFSNCKKKPPEPTLLEQFPKRTETGAEKLVGIVNNEYIFSNNGIPWIDPVHGLYSWYTENLSGQLYINGYFFHRDQNWVKHEEQLIIELTQVYGEGIYTINEEMDYTSGAINGSLYIKNGLTYHTDSTQTGTLVIRKFDTVNNIFSGTFNLNLINDETNETITITNGWFDIID